MYMWKGHKIIVLPSTEIERDKKATTSTEKPVLSVTPIEEEFMSEMKACDSGEELYVMMVRSLASRLQKKMVSKR